MTPAGEPPVLWSEPQPARTVAYNAAARYAGIVVELALGLVMLPFNASRLGAADYGLWMLAASVAAYFPLFDLGYGGAMDRFVAYYRARRDARAINEIASTLAVVFGLIGLGVLAAGTLVAWQFDRLFNVSPAQAASGPIVLLLVTLQFALGLPFGVYGAIVNGFQRTFLNSAVSAVVSAATAAVNAAVLLAGGDLVQLVAALTATRLLGYIAYRWTAHRVFPPLRVRPQLFCRARLGEVTGFSTYIFLQTAATKVNYAADPLVIGAFLTTGAVAVWTVAQRLTDAVMRLADQLNEVLFPVVVDCDSRRHDDRLREVLVQGTRISLAIVLPAAGALAILARRVVTGWTGAEFAAAVPLVQILAVVTIVRVGTSTARVVLRGAGHHRLLAWSNVIAAAANVALSVVLIRTHGLPGVALATLLAVAVRAGLVVLPAAAARVGLGVRQLLVRAIWPALWPAAISLALLAALPAPDALRLRDAVGLGALATVLHGGLFVALALDRRERARYLAGLRAFRPSRAAARPVALATDLPPGGAA
jgi:O-antigen/teichoic acid export membrane protein